MATVREGHQGALLIVDMQAGVLADAWDAGRVVARAARAVERARAQGVPVLWVQHADDELLRDSAAWQIVPGLQPLAGEARIHKRYNSSFEDTALARELDRLGVSHIVLAGAASNWCIRATAYAALERGYDLTLVADAHTTTPMASPGGNLIPAAAIVDELNAVVRWLSYPGRHSGTASAETVEFDGPAAGG
jgi:nicotinamidase-related amidase